MNARASSRVGRGGGRKPRMRSRSSGPVGCDARNGSRRDRSLLGGGWPARRRRARRRRVARPECLACVDPSGHRPSRLRTRRAAATRWRTVELHVRSALPGLARAVPCVGPRQGRIGVVDLRHQARCHPRGRGIVAGQVGMVLPGEPPPGGLDRRGAGAARYAENVMGIAFDHVPSVAARPVTPREIGSGSRFSVPDEGERLTAMPTVPSPLGVSTVRRASIAAAVAAAQVGLAYRFALAYRARAGYPRRHEMQATPDRPRHAVRGNGRPD